MKFQARGVTGVRKIGVPEILRAGIMGQFG
jgi:hypothetical protein